jgi:hypothetical protein
MFGDSKLIIPKCEEYYLQDIVNIVLEKHDLKDYPIEVKGIREREKMKEKLKWDWEEL